MCCYQADFHVILALSFEKREDLINATTGDGEWMDLDEVEQAAFNTLPPGEEGLLQSHEGGEAEIIQTLFEVPRR